RSSKGCRRTLISSISNCRIPRSIRSRGWAAPRPGSPILVSHQNGIEAIAPRRLSWIGLKRNITKMELRRFIRTDITASAIAHLSVLALVFLFTEVHPFGVVTAEPIAVDIVTPDEVPTREPEPAPPPEPPTQTAWLDAPSQSKPEAADPPQPPPAQQPPDARPSQQAALSPSRSSSKAAAAQPQPQPAAPAALPAPPAQAARSAPAYAPPEPDLTLKYHVMLGLPEDLPLAVK